MKVYTVKDLETFNRDEEGRLICPSGDYTQIKSFGRRCIFGKECLFGDNCIFRDGCSFGDYCIFGSDCRFGDYCNFSMSCFFGRSCRFGDYCIFGDFCRFSMSCFFGRSCRFGMSCFFGERCSFGSDCNFSMSCFFGERCSFGKRCTFSEECNLCNYLRFENLNEIADRVLKIDCIGSRDGCTYFYKTVSEIYVRCGCFFGTISEFENQVNETHKDNPQYLLEYTEAIKYAKTVLGFKKHH